MIHVSLMKEIVYSNYNKRHLYGALNFYKFL